MTLEGLVLKLKNKYVTLTASCRRKKIKSDDFTIISNNCWGGIVYESYGIKKMSPTVGCFFLAEEYLKFVSNFEYYVKECSIEFVSPNEARHKSFYESNKNFGEFPIARIGDVEIAMLHYKSEEEAREKWNRRCKRINFEKLIFKLNDQNLCDAFIIDSFLNLPHKHKLFFTVDEALRGKNDVFVLPKFRGQKTVNIINEPIGSSKICDINKLINTL